MSNGIYVGKDVDGNKLYVGDEVGWDDGEDDMHDKFVFPKYDEAYEFVSKLITKGE